MSTKYEPDFINMNLEWISNYCAIKALPWPAATDKGKITPSSVLAA
jgi:hypothetical protein